MKHIKTFEGYSSDKFYFYDKDGKWFSSGRYTKSIENHKNRFGDDITFSVDGIDRKFTTLDEYIQYRKDNNIHFGQPYSEDDIEDDIEDAKKRVVKKREDRKKKWWKFN
jgi:hypothetical protein